MFVSTALSTMFHFENIILCPIYFPRFYNMFPFPIQLWPVTSYIEVLSHPIYGMCFPIEITSYFILYNYYFGPQLA